MIPCNHCIEVRSEPRVQPTALEPGLDAPRARRVMGDDDGREPGPFRLLELRLDERPVLGVAPCGLARGESPLRSPMVPDGACEVRESLSDLEVGPASPARPSSRKSVHKVAPMNLTRSTVGRAPLGAFLASLCLQVDAIRMRETERISAVSDLRTPACGPLGSVLRISCLSTRNQSEPTVCSVHPHEFCLFGPH